jgi:ribosomal protein S18 acetylase RimI-like enzyme
MVDTLLTLRKLGEADAEAFTRLRLMAIADSPTAIWPTHEEESQRTREETAARLRHTPQQVVFGMFDGDTLIAIAGLRREPLRQVAHKALVWGVFVAPAYRGNGTARRLLGEVLSHARESGIAQLHLCVNSQNAPAQALYRALGFTTYGVEVCAICVNGRYYDEDHMALRLID